MEKRRMIETIESMTEAEFAAFCSMLDQGTEAILDIGPEWGGADPGNEQECEAMDAMAKKIAKAFTS